MQKTLLPILEKLNIVVDSLLNENFEAEWQECFTWCKSLDEANRMRLRRYAADSIVSRYRERGIEDADVGSSDVNHEIFSIYRSTKGDIHQIILDMVDFYADR